MMEVFNLLGANKVMCSPLSGARISFSPSRTVTGPRCVFPRKLKVAADYSEHKQTEKDKWRGLAFDTSDDQQDITRGKGMVDTLFQAPVDSGNGTHYAVMSSYDYISAGLRQ